MFQEDHQWNDHPGPNFEFTWPPVDQSLVAESKPIRRLPRKTMRIITAVSTAIAGIVIGISGTIFTQRNSSHIGQPLGTNGCNTALRGIAAAEYNGIANSDFGANDAKLATALAVTRTATAETLIHVVTVYEGPKQVIELDESGVVITGGSSFSLNVDDSQANSYPDISEETLVADSYRDSYDVTRPPSKYDDSPDSTEIRVLGSLFFRVLPTADPDRTARTGSSRPIGSTNGNWLSAEGPAVSMAPEVLVGDKCVGQYRVTNEDQATEVAEAMGIEL